LDPRLGDAYDWGMKYFLEKIRADAVFPMHLWEQYEVSRKVVNWKNYRSVDAPGQVWDLRS
jgi:hypothetical protein